VRRGTCWQRANRSPQLSRSQPRGSASRDIRQGSPRVSPTCCLWKAAVAPPREPRQGLPATQATRSLSVAGTRGGNAPLRRCASHPGFDEQSSAPAGRDRRPTDAAQAPVSLLARAKLVGATPFVAGAFRLVRMRSGGPRFIGRLCSCSLGALGTQSFLGRCLCAQTNASPQPRRPSNPSGLLFTPRCRCDLRLASRAPVSRAAWTDDWPAQRGPLPASPTRASRGNADRRGRVPTCAGTLSPLGRCRYTPSWVDPIPFPPIRPACLPPRRNRRGFFFPTCRWDRQYGCMQTPERVYLRPVCLRA
jgi:hypothetical protein